MVAVHARRRNDVSHRSLQGNLCVGGVSRRAAAHVVDPRRRVCAACASPVCTIHLAEQAKLLLGVAASSPFTPAPSALARCASTSPRSRRDASHGHCICSRRHRRASAAAVALGHGETEAVIRLGAHAQIAQHQLAVAHFGLHEVVVEPQQARDCGASRTASSDARVGRIARGSASARGRRPANARLRRIRPASSPPRATARC